MIKVDKKEYKTKPIDLDLRFEVLTRVTKDGERVMPNTLLWIVRNTVDIADEELNDMGYELEPIEVDEDTLVIGNVAGFHSRADASTEHIRNAIPGSIRLELPLESE